MIGRILRALVPVGVVVVVATAGYVVLWDWSLTDAFYMTVITIGTVGYREIQPLTQGGQMFTAGVIIGGVAAAAYAVGRIADLLLAEQLEGAWKDRKMNRRIGELNGHTVVAGTGRVGSVVARELAAQGCPFVVVDECEDCIQAAGDAGWLYVHGDATEEGVLRTAGIERAGSLVSALDSDAENLFVTVTARALNPALFIVSRSSHETTERKLLQGGANRVLTPNVIGGRRMATMVMHPTVSDYLDLVSHGSGLEYRLQEVVLGEGSVLDSTTIAEARVRETTGAYILAVRHTDGTIDTNPPADTRLSAGDRLVVLGTHQQVDALMRRA